MGLKVQTTLSHVISEADWKVETEMQGVLVPVSLAGGGGKQTCVSHLGSDGDKHLMRSFLLEKKFSTIFSCPSL